jgi:hypothetical protein
LILIQVQQPFENRNKDAQRTSNQDEVRLQAGEWKTAQEWDEGSSEYFYDLDSFERASGRTALPAVPANLVFKPLKGQIIR